MRPEMEPFATACSELPNDNLDLHAGAVFVPRTTTGRPRAVSRPPRAAPPPPPPPEAFGQLVSLLVKVALGSGATRAAAVLPDFLAGQAVDLPIAESSVAVKSERGFVMSDSAARAASAWRAVLNGQSDDLSSCEETLDAWCADVVAALSGTPARSNELRRELRRFGVAAFGLLAA